MSYIGSQYGFAPQTQRTGTSSGASPRAGSQMPQAYKSKSTSPKPGQQEQRLVILAKHPNATESDIENARFQKDKRKQQQRRQQQQQPKGSPPEKVHPVHTHTQEVYDLSYQHESRQEQFHQGAYGEEKYEEMPPPTVDPYHHTPHPSVFGGLFGKIFASSDNQSVGGASKDYTFASDPTMLISNVDEKARAKRLRQEEGRATLSDRCGNCCNCLFKTRRGLVLVAFLVAIILAGVLAVGAALGGNFFGINSNETGDDDGNEKTWIPRPINEDDDGFTNLPTLSPTTMQPTVTSGEEGKPQDEPSGRITSAPSMRPTPNPTPLPTPHPTPGPTLKPTTSAPTKAPTKNPTPGPTPNPTPQPTPNPTLQPTPNPTPQPTPNPTPQPTSNPTPITSSPTFIFDDPEQLGSVIQGTQSDQQFGYSVALSKDGKVLAVGMPTTDVVTDPTEPSKADAGMVQVYEWLNDQWTARGPALIGRNQGDKFGSAVALSEDGSMLVATEPTYAGEAGSRSGNVRTFVYGPGNQYTPLGDELEGVAASDHFGISLALSGNGLRLAVGAPYHDNSDVSSRVISGEVRAFELQNDNWEQVGNAIAGESHFDWFGWSVDLSDDGNLLCAGAPRNLEHGGYFRCFEYVNEEWESYGGKNVNPTPKRYDDSYGHTLRLSGNRLAVGSPGKNFSNKLDSGIVIVYEYDETTKNWERLGNVITSPSPGNSFQLGFAIDFEGDVLVVGTPGKDNRGQVDLYSYNGSNEQWQSISDPLVGEEGSNFGYSVQMSDHLAVGSAKSAGINGGYVSVYRNR